MANHMSTTLTIENLDKQSYDKLKEIFNDGTNQYYTDVEYALRQMWGDTFKNDYEWWVNNVGSKWLEIESAVIEDFEEEVQIYLTSAWNVPDGFIEKLRDILVQINNKVVLSGTYEDESLDPMGAFIYADGYDDIEDADIEVYWDKYWDEDDDGEYREGIYEDLLNHKECMYNLYLEVLADRETE